MDGFSEDSLARGDSHIFLRKGGSGPAVLLLHGFPQTHLMWRDIAPRLSARFTVVCPDLRGYGRSGCPASTPDHAPYSKKAMAAEMVELMATLGFDRFMVAGHDRGGRVAYRMAADHPNVVERLAVLDVVPTSAAWEHVNAELALSFWPWSLLAQPAPLPERLIGADPGAVIEAALTQWGTPSTVFTPSVRRAYVDALSDATHVHAICEEYRAAATIDREHDATSLAAGRRPIRGPVLALWSRHGGLNRWYEAHGGPLGLWRQWSSLVTGAAVEGGHFFPEEQPAETTARLEAFFDPARRSVETSV